MSTENCLRQITMNVWLWAWTTWTCTGMDMEMVHGFGQRTSTRARTCGHGGMDMDTIMDMDIGTCDVYMRMYLHNCTVYAQSGAKFLFGFWWWLVAGMTGSRLAYLVPPSWAGDAGLRLALLVPPHAHRDSIPTWHTGLWPRTHADSGTRAGGCGALARISACKRVRGDRAAAAAAGRRRRKRAASNSAG